MFFRRLWISAVGFVWLCLWTEGHPYLETARGWAQRALCQWCWGLGGKKKRLSTGVRHPGSHPWNCVWKRLKIAGSWFLLTFLLRFMGEASTWTRHGRRHSKQETSGNIRKPGDSAEGDSTICHFVWATWRSWWTTWSCTCECRGRKTIAI